MKVRIDDWHIKTGVKCGSRCPIANAVTALLPAGQFATVGTTYVAIHNPKGAKETDRIRTFDLPGVAVRFIADYDDGREVKPFEFDVDISQEGKAANE